MASMKKLSQLVFLTFLLGIAAHMHCLAENCGVIQQVTDSHLTMSVGEHGAVDLFCANENICAAKEDMRTSNSDQGDLPALAAVELVVPDRVEQRTVILQETQNFSEVHFQELYQTFLI